MVSVHRRPGAACGRLGRHLVDHPRMPAAGAEGSGGDSMPLRSSRNPPQRPPLTSRSTTVKPGRRWRPGFRQSRRRIRQAARGSVRAGADPDLGRRRGGGGLVSRWQLRARRGRKPRETAAHVASVAGDVPRVGGVLSKMLGKLGQLPGIPAKEMDASAGDASHVIAWLLAGLKNWEQGMLAEAGKCFSAVADAKISPDEQWLAIYQNFARDYLADQKLLSAPVFEKLPADAAACDAAVAELDGFWEIENPWPRPLQRAGLATGSREALQTAGRPQGRAADAGPVTPACPCMGSGRGDGEAGGVLEGLPVSRRPPLFSSPSRRLRRRGVDLPAVADRGLRRAF